MVSHFKSQNVMLVEYYELILLLPSVE